MKKLEYSDVALEPLRGMPPLDFLSVEMESHTRDEYLSQYGHVSYYEQRTGVKPRLDLSPLMEIPIPLEGLEICEGYDQVYRLGRPSTLNSVVP